MTGVSGTGAWPGLDALDAASVVVGDLADPPSGITGLPFTVLLPGRGPWGDRAGHAAAVLAELPTELGPHGWKLADRPGGDVGRARAYLREDLDALAVAAHGYTGPLVVPVLGPLTFAATVYLARGDRVLADPGAVREVTASLAAGVGEHLAALRVAVPGAEPTVLVHEPLLAQVLAGVLPTFSGYSALRAVPGPVAAEQIGAVADGARHGGASAVVVHGGSAWVSLPAIRHAGVDGVGLAVAGFDERAWERVAEAVEGGLDLWAEVPRQGSSQCAGPDVAGQADVLLRPWRSVGLPSAGLRGVVLLAGDEGGTPDDARAGLAGVVKAATIVAERAED
ncbi:hypothetical protein [Cellulomonas sp. URHB0016]